MFFIFSGKQVWFRFIPIPTMTAVPGTYSHKIPESFLPFNKMSFGHLSFNGTDGICCSMADTVATPAIRVMRASFSADKFGFKSMDK